MENGTRPQVDIVALTARVAELELLLASSVKQRQAERAARIRLQRSQRSLPPELQPLGFLHSCFSRRNGTPRQPGLVPAARAVLVLRPDIPPQVLDGLHEFSHCWVIYLFHANTNLHGGVAVKSRVAVPRLDGSSRGVLATRSPHRPACPVGLSLARVLRVSGRRLFLGGLDCVDGSPVLDVKPFVPFCDAPAGAFAPPWVAHAAPGAEPLRVESVDFAGGAKDALWSAYLEAEEARKRGAAVASAAAGDALRDQQAAAAGAAAGALYCDREAFCSLVSQVLALDIRSLRQRTGAAPALEVYHVILGCVEVDYTITEETSAAGVDGSVEGGGCVRRVAVLGGRRALPEAEWEAAQEAAAERVEGGWRGDEAVSATAGEGE